MPCESRGAGDNIFRRPLSGALAYGIFYKSPVQHGPQKQMSDHGWHELTGHKTKREICLAQPFKWQCFTFKGELTWERDYEFEYGRRIENRFRSLWPPGFTRGHSERGKCCPLRKLIPCQRASDDQQTLRAAPVS